MPIINPDEIIKKPDITPVIQDNHSGFGLKEINDVITNIRSLFNDIKPFIPNTNKQTQSQYPQPQEGKTASEIMNRGKTMNDNPQPAPLPPDVVTMTQIFQFVDIFMSKLEELGYGDKTLNDVLSEIPKIKDLHSLYRLWLSQQGKVK